MYKDMLNQIATYWAPDGEDDYGNQSFASPLEIDVRWEDDSELLRDEEGNEIMSNAVVYTDSDLKIEGYLYRGSSNESDPNDVEGAREIRQYEKMPSLEGDVFLRKAWLYGKRI